MCQRVRCRKCGKATWAGCGAHADQVLRGVPESERCRCREEAAATGAAPAAGGGWLRRLLGG